MGGVLRWLGYMERMERDMIGKGVYVGEGAGSRSVGRSRKRWINTVGERLKKRERFGCQASNENVAR